MFPALWQRMVLQQRHMVCVFGMSLLRLGIVPQLDGYVGKHEMFQVTLVCILLPVVMITAYVSFPSASLDVKHSMFTASSFGKGR